MDSVSATVTALVEPVLEPMGYELVDTHYVSEHGRWVLRIFVDREGGITLDECVSLSREIGPLIDVKDVIPHEYVLEVSSPGLDRPLRKERDFVRALGKKIRVRMAGPVDGQRNFVGSLRDFCDGMVLLEPEQGPEVSLPLEHIEKARLVYEFDGR